MSQVYLCLLLLAANSRLRSDVSLAEGMAAKLETENKSLRQHVRFLAG